MTLAIAVLTLTRDRLEYTQHCFQMLRKYAGTEFDHYVLDQGSTDGTPAWLTDEFDTGALSSIVLEPNNVGICRGLNMLLDHAFTLDDYDVVIKFDNDCELVQPDTIRDVARLTADGGCLLSPRILGLRQPPAVMRELRIGDETILDIHQIGGIFTAAPGWIYNEFRFDESQMLYDDVQLCHWWRSQGGTCGYVNRLEAWHYETTDGQQKRYPDYWERKMAEMGSV